MTRPWHEDGRKAFRRNDVWAGAAELTIAEVRGEDMHSLAPMRIGRGYRLGMSYSVTDLRILRNYVA
jgi:acetoacetate decarboxylase